MPQPSLTIDPRHVLLPWARPIQPLEGDSQSVARRRVERDERALRVAGDRLTIGSQDPSPGTADAEKTTPAGAPGTPLPHSRVPFDPEPSIPTKDRAPLEAESLVSAAIALDVLTTLTHSLDASPAILAELTHAAVIVGRLGGLNEENSLQMVTEAHGDIGRARTTIGRRLFDSMGPSPHPEQTSPPSTPRSVHTAVGRLSHAARVARRDVRLRLQTGAPITYWQA